MARNSTLHIAVKEDIKRELQHYAERYGITTSALGAFIIGQWIYSQKKYVGPVLDMFQSEIREKIRNVLNDEA